MPLQKAKIDIPLHGGERQDADTHLMDPPFVRDSLNTRYDKYGRVGKRKGLEQLIVAALPTSTTGFSTIFDAGGYEAMWGRDGLYVWSETQQTWLATQVPMLPPCRVSDFGGTASLDDITFYDVAVGNKFVVEVWTTGLANWYCVRDKNTNAVLKPATQYEADAGFMRVQFFDDGTNEYFQWWYLDGNVLRATNMNEATTTTYTWAASTNFQTVTDAVTFDISHASGEGAGYIAYVTTGNAAIVYDYDYALANTNTSTLTATADVVGTHKSAGGDLWVVVSRASTDVVGAYLNATLSTKTEVTGLFTAPTGGIMAVALHETIAGRIFVALSERGVVDPDSTGNNFTVARTRWRIFSDLFADYSNERTIPNMYLATKMFRPANHEPCVGLEYFYETVQGRTVQPATLIYTLDTDTETITEGAPSGTVAAFEVVLARVFHDVSASHNNTGGFASHCPPMTTTKFVVPGLLKTGENAGRVRLRAGGRFTAVIQAPGTDKTDAASRLIEFDPGPVRVENYQDNQVLASGTLLSFDEQSLLESSVFFTPEMLHVEPIVEATSGPFKDAAVSGNAGQTWRFAVVYSFKDKHGIIHRSAPSLQFRESSVDQVAGTITSHQTFIKTGGTATEYKARVHITVPLGILRAQDGNPLRVDIYMTDSGGTPPFYYVATKNITLNGFVGYVDVDSSDLPLGTPDFLVSANPALYTTGQVLESLPPPSMSSIVRSGDRLYGINAEQPEEIWVTKTSEPTIAPEWNGNLSILSNEAATALGTLEDKVLSFTEKEVFYIPPGGPSNTGLGDFSSPVLLSSDTGCTQPISVVEGEDGLYFRGIRGFYKVDRGLNLTYIGGAVEDTTDGTTCTAAVLVPQEHEIRFRLDNNKEVRWNYEKQAWSIREAQNGHSAMVAGRYVEGSNSTGGWDAFAERADSDTNFDDASLDPGGGGFATYENQMRLTTPWIKTNGIQGFNRIWWAKILGIWNTGKVNVEVGFDYDEHSWPQSTQFDVEDLAGGMKLASVTSIGGGQSTITLSTARELSRISVGQGLMARGGPRGPIKTSNGTNIPLVAVVSIVDNVITLSQDVTTYTAGGGTDWDSSDYVFIIEGTLEDTDSDIPMSLRIKPVKQKCKAIRFRIAEIAEYPTFQEPADPEHNLIQFGAGFTISGITLEVGVDPAKTNRHHAPKQTG